MSVYDLPELAAKRGFEVVKEYRDCGISGRRARRPGLDSFLLSIWFLKRCGYKCGYSKRLSENSTDRELVYNDELTARKWALNSAVECHLHTVEVIGSNPIAPTTSSRMAPGFGGLSAPLGISPFDFAQGRPCGSRFANARKTAQVRIL